MEQWRAGLAGEPPVCELADQVMRAEGGLPRATGRRGRMKLLAQTEAGWDACCRDG